MATNDKMIVNNKLERLWNEAAKATALHFPEGTE
jgi:hypothetical protein